MAVRLELVRAAWNNQSQEAQFMQLKPHFVCFFVFISAQKSHEDVQNVLWRPGQRPFAGTPAASDKADDQGLSHQNPALLIMTPQQPIKGRSPVDAYLASTVSGKTKKEVMSK